MKKKMFVLGCYLLDFFWYVPRFAWAMRMKIWKRRHRYSTGHWRFDSAWGWLACIRDEVEELRDEMELESIANHAHGKSLRRNFRKNEAVDIANYAMMAAYAYDVDEAEEASDE